MSNHIVIIIIFACFCILVGVIALYCWLVDRALTSPFGTIARGKELDKIAYIYNIKRKRFLFFREMDYFLRKKVRRRIEAIARSMYR